MSKGIPPITDPSAPDSTNINNITGHKNEITWINEKKYTYGAVTNFVVGATTTLTAGAITAVSLAAVTNTLGGTKEELHMMGKADMTLGPVYTWNFSRTTKFVTAKEVKTGTERQDVYGIFSYVAAVRKENALKRAEVIANSQRQALEEHMTMLRKISQSVSETIKSAMLDVASQIENRSSVVSKNKSSFIFTEAEINMFQ